MNLKDIFETVSLIDDDLIAEAADPAMKIRRIKLRRIAILAAAVVMLLSVTVIAANIILGGRGGHSSSIPSYYSVPSRETLLRDTGIAPAVPESFSSGYVFDSGYITYNEDFDTEGATVEEYKGLQFSYTRNGDEISFFIDAAAAGIQADGMDVTEDYKGSELFCYSYTNKLVPPDYRPTEEDRQAEQNGDIVISYGSTAVEYSRVQGVKWEYAGLNYELAAVNADISETGLLQIVHEMIDAQQ